MLDTNVFGMFELTQALTASSPWSQTSKQCGPSSVRLMMINHFDRQPGLLRTPKLRYNTGHINMDGWLRRLRRIKVLYDGRLLSTHENSPI